MSFNLSFSPSLDCPSNCNYCRGPNEDSKIMEIDTIQKTIEWVNNYRDDPVIITFDGGEPLLAGFEFYRKVLPLLNDCLKNDIIEFAIQTNLWLLTAEIAELFSKYNVSVGSSLDGPERINDIQRGKGYFKKTMRGYEIAKAHNLNVNFICTFTSNSIEFKDDIFNFFHDNNIKMRLNPALPSLRNDKPEKWAVSPQSYGELLVEFFKKYLKNIHKMEIRNLNELVKTLYFQSGTICTFANCMGDIFAIGPGGDIYPCYRLVGMKEYSIGNVHNEPRKEDFYKFFSWNIFHEYKYFIDMECSECQHIKYCRGGCPYNALIDLNGRFKSVDPYCHSYNMIFNEINKKGIETLINLLNDQNSQDVKLLKISERLGIKTKIKFNDNTLTNKEIK